MCLFPSIEDNTPATFYEILGTSSLFQLLKYTSKRIKESAVYGGAPLKEYVMDDLFYIYDKAAKKMLAMGSALSLKSIKKTLPNDAAQIDVIINSNKLNLKKEEDMIQLIQQLKASSN
jgi:regulator of sigma D